MIPPSVQEAASVLVARLKMAEEIEDLDDRTRRRMTLVSKMAAEMPEMDGPELDALAVLLWAQVVKRAVKSRHPFEPGLEPWLVPLGLAETLVREVVHANKVEDEGEEQ